MTLQGFSHDAPPPAVAPGADPAAEANHRIANNLAMLGSLVRMQARGLARSQSSFSAAEVRLLLGGMAARIAAISQLHRLFSQEPEGGMVALSGHLREVSQSLVAIFSSPGQPVEIVHRGTECLVPTRCAQPLTLMVCEIVTNAMKHSHPAGLPVHLEIACRTGPQGSLVLSVADDGVGLPEGFDAQRDGGLGFQVIRALANEMGAGLQILSPGIGLVFRLTLPQAIMANPPSA